MVFRTLCSIFLATFSLSPFIFDLFVDIVCLTRNNKNQHFSWTEPFFKVVNLSITLCCWIVFGGSSHCLYLLLFCCPPASTFECVSSIFMASPCRRLIFMQRKIMKGDEEGAINEKYPVLNEAASYLIGIFSFIFMHMQFLTSAIFLPKCVFRLLWMC